MSERDSQDQRNAPAGRRRRMLRGVIPPLAVIMVIAILCGLGIAGYFSERDVHQTQYQTGALAKPNRIDVDVTLQRMDASARQLTLIVLATPVGTLADTEDNSAPARDLVIETSSLSDTTLRYPARQRIPAHTIRVGLDTGIVSDYPFDRYMTNIGFYASTDQEPVPISLTFGNSDTFFATAPIGAEVTTGSAAIELRISRSRGTFIFAWFLMVGMWILALSVLGAAWIIISQRRGLVWPALGWLAATLFALVAVRNALPGSPPIGSLFDYASFLWAEIIVAASLGGVVIAGVVVERNRES